MGSLDNTFGAALIGLVVEATLFGITLVQAFFYFRNYGSSDHWFTKALVIFLTLVDTLHLVLCVYTVYWYLVTHFGDSGNLELVVWSLTVQTDFQTLVAVTVECFFARRLWLMSKNRFIAASIIVLSIGQIIAVVVFTVDAFRLGEFAKFSSLTWEIILGLGGSTVADIIIAVAMCYYLYRRRTGLRRTDSLVTALMVYSVNSGMTTSVIATLSLILFLAMPTNLIWIAVFWLIGKCYVNSFLALRDHLRDRAHHGGVVPLSSFAARLSRSGTPPPGLSPRGSRGLANAAKAASLGVDRGGLEVSVAREVVVAVDSGLGDDESPVHSKGSGLSAAGV
ncbi:uncharacterized protein BXZ73DRAFT_103326 [Epithele typhae]|uniref:uncharacterized protein n=1 Tax=Epithele typhae TaxID=378194 RepID=UPI0020078E1A|nr:uncharacterized protein BXZ73DRAFT_103326 [Epithele typhae]KAH9925451.1 hypothetical protein BXZ73DRAFT_103326 [Epithele typhae]